MLTAIYLEPAMVPATLRGTYSGKQFKAYVVTETTIPFDAGLWSGGSRDKYFAIDLSTGQHVTLPGQNAAPWDNSRRDIRTPIKPGYAVIRHTISGGKDLGLTFYIHPDNASKLLPAPAAEMPAIQRLVLVATASLKSSYAGKDRYQMAMGEYHCKQALRGEAFPTRDQWECAKAELIAGGYLNKAGAITTKGRNAAQ